MATVKDVFIGKKLKIMKSPMKHQIGAQGLIVDESKNTFTILHRGEEKKVLKNKRVFLIDGTLIEGEKIAKKPEERIKIKEK